MSKRRQDPRTDFGRYLRKLMDTHGYATDADLGRVADVDGSLLSKWQSGRAAPNITTLRKLAPHLHVRLADLLVAAGILTPDELAMAGQTPPPPPPLPAEVARLVRILNDPHIPPAERERLQRLVNDAIDYWQHGREAPREPSAAERAARTKARDGRTP